MEQALLPLAHPPKTRLVATLAARAAAAAVPAALPEARATALEACAAVAAPLQSAWRAAGRVEWPRGVPWDIDRSGCSWAPRHRRAASGMGERQ